MDGGASSLGSVGVGAQELGAQDGLVETHAAVELERDIEVVVMSMTT